MVAQNENAEKTNKIKEEDLHENAFRRPGLNHEGLSAVLFSLLQHRSHLITNRQCLLLTICYKLTIDVIISYELATYSPNYMLQT